MASLYKMYKGLEGSPTSKIVQGISVSATTIVVQDPSVLPAAPNFACLFDDTGKIEVVEYTQKSGQTLTCIRGVSGQRLEWPIATSIARNFTSIDYNNLVDNVSMMNVELNELALEYGYIFDSVVQGDFVQQVLQMAEQVEALNGEVNTMLDNLTTLEEQLQQAEQTRQTNETARQTAEGQRSNAESGRVTAEQNRVSSESGRVAAEQTRQSNEQTRQNNETTRETTESGRVTAESSRVTAEQGRVDAESSRVLVEQGRATAESGRVTAEQTREQKETTRQTNETARQTAESSRASAESQRDNNETSRQTNEDQRQTSEGQRNSAESLRVTAESSRAVAESSRVSAESARETAESARVSNETNRQAQLTDAINAASVSAQQAQGFRDSAYSHAQHSESMKDQAASYAIDAEAAAVRAEYVATSLGGIQDWALQPTKPTYTYSEVGAAAATHYHIVSDIIDFPTSMPASDVYPWAKDESKPVYTAAEIGAASAGHVHDYAPSTHNHIVADITDFPTEMPASDVSAWAKSPTPDSIDLSANDSIKLAVRVGGTNLLPNSKDTRALIAYTTDEVVDSNPYVGYLDPGTEYTLSGVFIMEGNCEGLQVLAILGNYSDAIEVYADATKGVEKHFSATFTTPAYSGKYWIRVDNEGSSNGLSAAIWYHHFKLEKGNIATDWSPATQDVTLAAYPVGAIYMSVASTSPATLFGGTWAALGGRMLIGVDGTYTAGTTGGAATHTLALTQIPNATGMIIMHGGDMATDIGSVSGVFSSGRTLSSYGTHSPGIAGAGSVGIVNFSLGGGGQSHNNLPPYLAVYMWKRTA